MFDLTLLDGVMQSLLLGLFAVYVFFGIDDLFVDMVAWFARLRPARLSSKELRKLRKIKEKHLAILVANWKEAGIIERMIEGNYQRIDYNRYVFVLGVYPNDKETLAEAERVSKRFKNVEIVVNRSHGPTSKGQMLNEVLSGISEIEEKRGYEFDGFMIHDSEDIIHPKSLRLVNYYLDNYGFIQIPIFSLKLSPWALVSGTYMDEFAEVHTKDILVRSYLGAPIPSAGVGTTISRAYLNRVFSSRESLFNESSVTEDYELGMRARQFGVRSIFVANEYENLLGNMESIATREFFPNKVWPSIKQKTRWTVGISLQGFENLGWSSNFWENYFYYRDRKGPLTNILVLFGMIVTAYFLLRFFYGPSLSLVFNAQLVGSLSAITSMFVLNRIFQRIVCTSRVYGFTRALLVPVRMIIGNFVNAVAAVRAVYQYAQSRLHGKDIGWSKTEHRLPASFEGAQ